MIYQSGNRDRVMNDTPSFQPSEAASIDLGEAESLTDLAYHRLEEEIVRLRLAPGTAVTEKKLSEMTGIGRTPVREALLRLANEGLVRVLPRRGLLISEINVGHQLLLLEVRREVERMVVRGAAKRASEGERATFLRIAEAMDTAATANDGIAFLRLDREFNELCLAAVRNPFAAKSLQLMQPLARRFWYLHYKAAADLTESATAHAAVARAIASGDEAAAVATQDALMDYIEKVTRSTVA